MQRMPRNAWSDILVEIGYPCFFGVIISGRTVPFILLISWPASRLGREPLQTKWFFTYRMAPVR
jgi:hypothetical protein